MASDEPSVDLVCSMMRIVKAEVCFHGSTPRALLSSLALTAATMAVVVGTKKASTSYASACASRAIDRLGYFSRNTAATSFVEG